MSKNSSTIEAQIDNPENWVDAYGDFLYQASAKSGGLLVKEYSALMPRIAMIIIDSDGPSAPDSFEKVVSYAASASMWLIDRGYYVGLDTPGAFLPYGTGKGHMYRMLDHLAGVKEDEVNRDSLEIEDKGAVIIVKKSRGGGYVLGSEPDMVVYADTL